AALKQYYAEQGDCLVPNKYVSQSGFKLGNWVNNQRQAGATLTKERVDRLNRIGFIWDPYEQQWEEGFSALKQYYAEHGDCLVPLRYATPSGFKLGNWVSNQRKAATTLSKERLDRLNRIGFVWDPYEQQWEKGFAALEQYYAEHGDCLVPGDYLDQSGYKLGSWVSEQRKKKDRLGRMRLDKLNNIGFVWKVQ
ncbi:helicase associated domain-containing protein, partial [Luminiphilus sp.]|nr:helicase associated domain-containing protein [Luminiphilus sp.]